MLLNAGFSRARALLYNALSGLAAVVGGVLGYFIVGPWESLFPYLLVVASSSFIYVAVADLIPQLQHRLTLRETVAQLGLARRRTADRRAGGQPAAGPLNAQRGPRRDQRTTSTGIFVCVSTFWVSLPSSSAETPRRPCEAITIRSQSCLRGMVDDRLPGVQRLDGGAVQVDAAAAHAASTAATCRAAIRSWASKNSCGGVGCISEIAPYGNGSLTQMV